ncbi:MAG: AI-2E family transporter [Thermodesulfobacteriota bacterium]|nr:AI-2E family transporter [Thermodesulfobacteriota bacterium]
MERQGRVFFFICLALILFLVYMVLRPFILTMVLSLITVVVFYPLYCRIKTLLRGKEGLASLVTCILIIVIVVLPLSVLIVFLAKEAAMTYAQIGPYLAQMSAEDSNTGMMHTLMAYIHRYLPGLDLSVGDMKTQATRIAGLFVGLVMRYSGDIVNNVTNIILKFVLMIFTLFYFFRDGPEWLRAISAVIPLPADYKGLIIERFRDVSISTVTGLVLTAVFQGIVGGIGFSFAGIPAVLWGTAIAFASLIPIVGCALVWFPAGIVLVSTGHLNAGIFVFVWGALVVSSVDNFLRPYLMQGSTHVSPLWILFSVLGGLKLFGFSGILIGPLAFTMALTFVLIYQEAYGPGKENFKP